MLWNNVERRINAAARLLEHTETSGMGNTAKSSYYRSAIILLCTVVEGMVYELVKKYTTPPDHILIPRSKTFKSKHRFPLTVFGSATQIVLCEELEEDICIDDTRADFGKFNIYLKNHKHISPAQYKNLNWVRIERNKVHLQGLNTPDTGYTKAKIERIGKVISFLEAKIT